MQRITLQARLTLSKSDANSSNESLRRAILSFVVMFLVLQVRLIFGNTIKPAGTRLDHTLLECGEDIQTGRARLLRSRTIRMVKMSGEY